MFTTAIINTLFAVLATLAPHAPHPHHPRAIKIGAAGGAIKVLYFTVPYNAEHLKGTKPGFEWHLGFATLETEVALRCGEVEIPKGKFKLNARFNDQGSWDCVLSNPDLAQARARVFFAETRAKPDDPKGQEAIKKAKEQLAAVTAKLAEDGTDKEYLLRGRDCTGADDEHLAMMVLNRGFATPKMGSDEPAGGVEFDVRIGFGTLHREIVVAEVFGQQSAGK